MVSNRRIVASLLFAGVGFVGVAHTVLAFAFDTGLAPIGIIVAGFSFLGLVAVNVVALLD
ncbi:hypothetical protein [Halomicrococcus sp. NG-SE-24]|uniref:hypothetical protein n=1 Tax=unclassified Halomicrococcus TaxID=2614448 RepID=UPI000DDC4872|nr:hypothetical protein DMJ13_02860 [halophilic archaeon]